MPFLSLIIGLIILGVVLWVVESLIPLDATIRRVIEVVIVLAVLVWVVRAFGLL